nr:MarR family transcriptional regulator [Desulfobulbaceae bacterium]
MPPCDDEALGRLIHLTAQDMRNFAEKILSPFDLTIEQLHLLKNLSCTSGMTQRQVGEIAGKTPANMSRILDRLEAKALIQRRSDPKDRRAAQVLLTDTGKEITENVFEVFESFSEDLVRGITENEQEIVKKSLKMIVRNLETMHGRLPKK